jgi:hypothetical protein
MRNLHTVGIVICKSPNLEEDGLMLGVSPSVESYVKLTICYLIEYAEDWACERSYIREDKALGSLDRLHELTAQAAN